MQEDRPTFYGVLISGWIGMGVNLCVLALFTWQNVQIMVMVNIVSVIVWAYYLRLTYQSKLSKAIYLACAEISIHAVFVVWILGTQYGFQFYLISISCLLSINPIARQLSNVWLSMGCLCLFAALYALFPASTNVVIFPEHVTLIFILSCLSATIPIVLGVMILKKEFVRQRNALERVAHYDVLTGLFNRRYFYTFLNEQNKQGEAQARSFFLAIADIDKFKSVNDIHGHVTGDDVLVAVSHKIEKLLGSKDKVARWGGEEFMFYLDETDLEKAHTQIDNLRAAIANDSYTPKRLRVTLSFGLAAVTPDTHLNEAVKQADRFLYEAKRSGRNCVVSESFAQKSEKDFVFPPESV